LLTGPAQAGSALVAAVGVVAAALLTCLVLLSLAGIFYTRQAADTAAAAAATAALRALRPPLAAALEAETAARLRSYLNEVAAAAAAATAQWEAGVWSGLARAYAPGGIPPGVAAQVAQTIARQRPLVQEEFRRQELGRRRPRLAPDLLAGRTPPLTLRVQEFLSPRELGCLVVAVAARHQPAMAAAAQGVAAASGATLVGEPQFHTGAAAYVTTRAAQPVRLLVFAAGLPDDARSITAPGSAHLTAVAGMAPEFQPPCVP
jgi:hypothetical protein